MKYFIFVFCLLLLIGCSQSGTKLPVLGKRTVIGNDSVYSTVADFSFTDQDNHIVTNQTFSDKIYVADFIFLSCPSICPRMTKAMYQVYLPYATDERVGFISHTIDPERDSIPKLKAYAGNLGVNSSRWHFVTGNRDSVMNLSENSYYSAAYPDSTAPGGFTHSGGLLLVDKDRHIRGVYNINRPEETDRLINDIKILLKEMFNP